MGRSWIVDGRIEVPPRVLAQFQRSLIGPSSDIPALLGGGDAGGVKVSALVKELTTQGHTATWAGAVLTIRAILDASGGVWADWRGQLASLPSAAVDVKGHGELVLVPAPDSDEDAGVQVKDGTFTLLRGAKLRAAQKRVASVIGEVVDRQFSKLPFITDPALRPIHAEVIRQLRAQPADAVMAAAKKERRGVFLRAGGDARLAKLYTDRNTLVSALEEGEPRLYEGQGDHLAAMALALLGEVDAATAGKIAKKVTGTYAKLTRGTDAPPMLAVAQTIEANASGGDLAAQLAALRKAMPKVVTYDTRYTIYDHPLVRQLAANKSPAVVDAVRAALKATLGGPLAGAAKWKPLTAQNAGYAVALLEILHAHPKERPALKVAYAKHPHFLVADRDRAR